MPEFDSVFSDASQLPVADRLRLIDELSATVPDDQPPSLSPAWIAEVEKRSSEVDAGTVSTVPWAEVRRELFRKTGADSEN